MSSEGIGVYLELWRSVAAGSGATRVSDVTDPPRRA